MSQCGPRLNRYSCRPLTEESPGTQAGERVQSPRKHAGLAEWSGCGLPSRLREFDSRSLLHHPRSTRLTIRGPPSRGRKPAATIGRRRNP